MGVLMKFIWKFSNLVFINIRIIERNNVIIKINNILTQLNVRTTCVIKVKVSTKKRN